MKYTSAPGYVESTGRRGREMYRQVGDLVLDDKGIARRGLIVRHLVLPGGFAGTRKTLEFIAGLSPAITVSIMSQYFPAHGAHVIPEISGKIGVEEYEEDNGDARRVRARERVDTTPGGGVNRAAGPARDRAFPLSSSDRSTWT